ncbi:MAG TPA: hypothetical protein VHN12_07470, partial [Geobacteraceae bacterium]|nr:hypothetical protein [Geobacteraceae bacterium]
GNPSRSVTVQLGIVESNAPTICSYRGVGAFVSATWSRKFLYKQDPVRYAFSVTQKPLKDS